MSHRAKSRLSPIAFPPDLRRVEASENLTILLGDLYLTKVVGIKVFSSDPGFPTKRQDPQEAIAPSGRQYRQ